MSGLDYFKSSLHADSSALGSFSSNLKEKCEEAGGEEDVFKQIKLDICHVEVQGSDVFNEELMAPDTIVEVSDEFFYSSGEDGEEGDEGSSDEEEICDYM